MNRLAEGDVAKLLFAFVAPSDTDAKPLLRGRSLARVRQEFPPPSFGKRKKLRYSFSILYMPVAASAW